MRSSTNCSSREIDNFKSDLIYIASNISKKSKEITKLNEKQIGVLTREIVELKTDKNEVNN